MEIRMSDQKYDRCVKDEILTFTKVLRADGFLIKDEIGVEIKEKELDNLIDAYLAMGCG
jgi:hypothetical protein